MTTAPVLVVLGVGAAGVAYAVVRLVRRGTGSILPAAPLSARRKFVLDAISRVVPSQYGDAKFREIAPGYDPDDPNLPPHFTTCGYLPCYVGRMLKVGNCITQGGLEQMRINGRKMGAWVEATGDNLPKPGDLYGIGSEAHGGGILVHVGVVIDAKKDQWTTADAGQGTVGAGQRAAYVTRPVDMKTITSGGTGAVYVPGTGWTVNGKPRNIAGWLDIDKIQGATP